MKKIAIPVLLLFVGLAGLIAMGVVKGGIPELQVRELLASTALPDRNVKVHGIIERIDSEKRPLRFTIRDKTSADKKVPVFCDRSRPDTFQVDYDVAVEGKLDAASGEFKADQIYTKCPSKYEAEEKYGRTSPVKAEAPPREAPVATRPK